MVVGCQNLPWWLLEVGAMESAEALHPPSVVLPCHHTQQEGKKRVICQGQRQPSPKCDLRVEAPTMNIIWPGMLWVDIRNIYNDVYQLRRLLGESPCDNTTAKKTHQSILESLKECLWHRWEHAQSPEQWDSDSALSSDPPPEFQPGVHAPYKHIKPDSYEEALAVVWDVHCHALITAHILEDHIEWLGWQVSCGWSCSHRWSCSHWHSHSHRHSNSHDRPLVAGYQQQVPPVAVYKGDSEKMNIIT